MTTNTLSRLFTDCGLGYTVKKSRHLNPPESRGRSQHRTAGSFALEKIPRQQTGPESLPSIGFGTECFGMGNAALVDCSQG